MREHHEVDAPTKFIGFFTKDLADLELSCAEEDVALKAFVTPYEHNKSSERIRFRFMVRVCDPQCVSLMGEQCVGEGGIVFTHESKKRRW